METLNELASSIKQAALERLGSPLIGSFILAWCVWNYRVITVLLSKSSAFETFALIDFALFPDWWTVAWRGFAGPLATALLYIYGYPPVANKIYGYLLKQRLSANALKMKIEGTQLLTREQSDAMLADRDDYMQKSEQTIANLTRQLEQANSLAERYKREYKDIAERTADSEFGLVASLSPEKQSILRVLDQGGREMKRDELREKTGLAGADFNRLLSDLSKLTVIEEIGRDSSNGVDWVRLEPLGHRVVATMAKARELDSKL
ncbi:MAG: hypothetical protein U1F53_23325 [Burkholderiaceae bacterium]